MKLSTEAQQWHDKIKKEYCIQDEPGLLLLQTAFEAFDEMRKAQEAMAGNPVFKDRFDQPKAHPAAKVARASRSQMIQALNALHLEIEPPEVEIKTHKKNF